MKVEKSIKPRNLFKRLAVWLVVVAAVLMIPLIARFPWTLGDFIFGFVMLFGAASMYEIVTKDMRSNARFIIGVAVGSVLFVLWVLAATSD